MYEKVFKEITEYLSMHLQLDVGILTEETRLDDLGIDSITFLEIVDFIKKKYDMDIPDDSILDLETLKALVDWIEREKWSSDTHIN